MQRRLAAILATDMVGYSRLMSVDEAGTVARQKQLRLSLIDPRIARHGGRIVKSTGDGLLVEFGSVVSAVTCAIELQRALLESEAAIPATARICYRVGVNLGEIIIDDDDIFGDGVNVAARLEALAPPGGLCISDSVHENLRTSLDVAFEDLGEQRLKNIARSLRVWRWSAAPEAIAENERPATGKGTMASSADHRPSVIVLPFVSMSAVPQGEQLADGMAEDLTTALSKIDALHVIARTTAFTFKNKALTAVQVAQEVGADYVIEGSVQIAGQRVRSHAQLIEARGGGHLWAERFDGRLDAIFELQDEISQKVMAALEVRFSEGEQVRLWRTEAADPAAYEDFLRGRTYIKAYSRTGNMQAKTAFRAALAITPSFHSAKIALARCFIEEANYGWSANRNTSLDEGKQLIDQVLQSCSGHASAHSELAHYLFLTGDLQGALTEAERGVTLDPTSADAQNVMAWVLLCQSRAQEALRYAQNALNLNPGTPEFYILVIADALVLLRRYEEALESLQRVLSRRPGWVSAHALRAICLQALGKHADAQASVGCILDRSPRFTVSRWLAIQHNPSRPDVAGSGALLRAAGLPA